MQPAERKTAGGYLNRVLASGARPFQFRATVRTLLIGVGAEGLLDHAHAPPPVGFTYALPLAPADLFALQGPEPFDAGGVLPPKIVPMAATTQAPGHEIPRQPEPGAGAAPHASHPPPRSGQPPRSARLPVEAPPAAAPRLAPAFEGGSWSVSESGRPSAVAKALEAARGDDAGARHPVPRAQAGHPASDRLAPAPRIESLSRRTAESPQSDEITTRAPTESRRGGSARGPRIETLSPSIPESARAEETVHGSRRASEYAQQAPHRMRRPAAQAGENAHPEAIDVIPQRRALKPRSPQTDTSDRSSHGPVRPGASDRSGAATDVRRAPASARPSAFRPEHRADPRPLQNLEQLRSSVQALVTKAVAAKAAPAEPAAAAPTPPAAQAAREVVVVRQAAEGQRVSHAFWERRHLGWPLLRILR